MLTKILAGVALCVAVAYAAGRLVIWLLADTIARGVYEAEHGAEGDDHAD